VSKEEKRGRKGANVEGPYRLQACIEKSLRASPKDRKKKEAWKKKCKESKEGEKQFDLGKKKRTSDEKI